MNTCSLNSHLKQHIKQVHDKIKDFKCQECEFKFSTKGKEEAEDNLKKIQETDNIKNEFCEKYGYKMIRINYNEIKNVLEILHYELENIGIL